MTTTYDRYEQRLRDAWKRDVTDEDGNPVHTPVLPDRASVRVPLVLMDAKSVPQPVRTLPVSDAERQRRQQRYDSYRHHIVNAWRGGNQ